MMESTIGKRIAALRKERGLTQDELAEKLGLSPQAVSKWENDISCPDILLLPQLAQLLGVTTDQLLGAAPKQETTLVPEDQRKSTDELLLKVIVNSVDGDRVRVNLPMALVKLAVEFGMQLPQFSGSEALKSLDIEQMLRMVEKGVIGKLVDIQAANGDLVEVVVE